MVDNFIRRFVNLLLDLRAVMILLTEYRKMIRATNHIVEIQQNLIIKIIKENQNTEFGLQHKFADISSYQDYIKNVPIIDYNYLRPYVEAQINTQKTVLNHSQPVLYNKTSGTTGKPKYIPVLSSSLKTIKKHQKLAFLYWRINGNRYYAGKILAIVSPAIEGYLNRTAPFGSTSGLLYKTMPSIFKGKYCLPEEVFEINSVDMRYFTILRLSLVHKNITFLSCANPSTLCVLKIYLNEHKDALLEDIKNNTINFIDQLPNNINQKITPYLSVDKSRYDELVELFNRKNTIDFKDVWPNLKTVAVWQSGNAATYIANVRSTIPKNAVILGHGFLASEGRITIPFYCESVPEAGIPTFEDIFFEFSPVEQWDNGNEKLIGLSELKQEHLYYVFITTPEGLYRYNMNDIVKVTGFLNQTPILYFHQKGKGITNITGEKVYEAHIIEAMIYMTKNYNFNPQFYILLANLKNSSYDLYLEPTKEEQISIQLLSQELDTKLQEINIEYKNKRESLRLKPLSVKLLETGTHIKFRNFYFNQGMRDAQFKPMHLAYSDKIEFDFDACLHHIL